MNDTVFSRGENPLRADKLNTAFNERVKRIGDTMQGRLNLVGDPVAPLEAATKQYVDRFTSMGVPSGAYIGAAPPGNVLSPLWWDTNSGQLYVQYNDGTSTQWVVANSLGDVASALGHESVVNVLDHGAKGDGTTDDTSAIYDALVVYAGQATILIPAGHTFRVSYLFVPSNTDLVINGTLKANDGDNEPVLWLNNVSNIRISGYGTLDGNKANVVPNCCGINMSNASNVQVSGITIQNTFYWALNIAGSHGIRIDSVTVKGSGAGSEFAAESDDCWLTNCMFDGSDSTDAGFSFYGGVTNSGAIGNTIKNTGINGSLACLGLCILADGSPGDATAQGCHNIIMANNLCYNNGASGIWVDVHVATIHSGIIITGNRCHDNIQFGGDSADIHVGNADNVTVIGNQSFNTKGQYGIGLFYNVAGNGISVVGNTIANAGQGTTAGVGLYVANVNDLNASGNHFYNQGTASMTTSIGGIAGARNAFVNNFLSAGPITITPQSDTIISNYIAGIGLSATNGRIGVVAPIGYANASNVARWYAGNAGNTEGTPGTNIGSDFQIVGVNDAGSALIAPAAIYIKRSSNAVTLAVAPTISTLPTNAANDAAAAAAGVQIGQEYRNGSIKMIRVA